VFRDPLRGLRHVAGSLPEDEELCRKENYSEWNLATR
jgi:hypothetical protein